jgi:hypothetical protein
LGDFDKEIPLHAPSLYAYDEIYRVEVNGWDELKKRKQEMVKEYHEKVCTLNWFISHSLSNFRLKACCFFLVIIGLRDCKKCIRS